MRVLVTGADRGLGFALAKLWAHRGYEVYAGVLDAPEWNGALSLHPLHLDVSNDTSVGAAAATLNLPIDILVNNAAILGDTAHTARDELDFDEMARVYNVNTLGALRVTRAFLPHLLAGHLKLVVNISSEAGSIGLCSRDSWYAYAMAKAALNQQSALIHNLLRPEGGRVLVLHPGHVRTLMRGHVDSTGKLTPDDAALKVAANIDRFGGASGALPEFRGPDGELLPW